jgi:hypothetical protein
MRGAVGGSQAVARGEIVRIGLLSSTASLLVSTVLKLVSVRLLEAKRLVKRFFVRWVLMRNGAFLGGSGMGFDS